MPRKENLEECFCATKKKNGYLMQKYKVSLDFPNRLASPYLKIFRRETLSNSLGLVNVAYSIFWIACWELWMSKMSNAMLENWPYSLERSALKCSSKTLASSKFYGTLARILGAPIITLRSIKCGEAPSWAFWIFNNNKWCLCQPLCHESAEHFMKHTKRPLQLKTLTT